MFFTFVGSLYKILKNSLNCLKILYMYNMKVNEKIYCILIYASNFVNIILILINNTNSHLRIVGKYSLKYQ